MVSGGFAYGYLHISQNPNVERVFNRIIGVLRPSRVLEIGTFHGGLTLLIRDLLDKHECENSIIRTYDIEKQNYLIPLVDERTEVLCKNLVNDYYTDFRNEECRKEIEDFINDGKPTLVLCDGGCKRCEYKILAPLLRDGDVIMAHDYAPDQKYFNEHMKDKLWDWFEIQDEDIKDSAEKYNLVDFQQPVAQTAAWTCKIKVAKE